MKDYRIWFQNNANVSNYIYVQEFNEDGTFNSDMFYITSEEFNTKAENKSEALKMFLDKLLGVKK